MELSHSVVNWYNLNNTKVKATIDILDKHINDYKKKIVRFKFSCKISSIIIRNYPKHNLSKNYKFKPSDIINMQITFITKLDNITYRHYLQQPRQGIENNLIKKFNQKPNLLKLFYRFPQPVFGYTVLKYWEFRHDLNGEDCWFYPYDWLNIEPHLHPIDVTNHA